LKQVPYLHGRYIKWPPPTPQVKTRFDSNYGEQEGGRDIYPDKNGHYHLFDEEELSVLAAPMQHTIPCVGFVVQEKARGGRLKFENVQELVDKNKDALKTMIGLRDHMKVFSILKKIQPNETFTFPDGTTISAHDIVEPERPGRKIIIMGDTCSGEHIAPLAIGADLLVHEATNAWIKDFDEMRYSHHSQHERDTKHHGHSTPHMAGKFAKAIGAKKLVLTHFSPRYKGDDSEQSMRIMWRIEDMARSTSGLQGANEVLAAWDNMSVSPTRN
jgi:ribonuclease Z